MFEIIDFSEWTHFDGLYAGSGRSEKIWLVSKDGKIGLFKYPKLDPQVHQITTEHISEHLAYQLGKVLHIKTATVDIGTYRGRIGSINIWSINQMKPLLRASVLFLVDTHNTMLTLCRMRPVGNTTASISCSLPHHLFQKMYGSK